MRKISSSSSLLPSHPSSRSSNSHARIKDSIHHQQAVHIHSNALDGSCRRAALVPYAQASTKRSQASDRCRAMMYSKDDQYYEVAGHGSSSSTVLAAGRSKEQLLLFARVLSHAHASSTSNAARACAVTSGSAQALPWPIAKEGSTEIHVPTPSPFSPSSSCSSSLRWLHRNTASDALLRKWVIEGGDIELGRRVGAGSTGEVYEGILHVGDVQETGTKVAVKVMAGECAAALRREVLALSVCKHRSVVPLVGVCRAHEGWHVRGGACVVTRLMEGGSLRSLLDREKALPTPRLLRIATDIALGLHHLHSRRIVHMDLKTPNIFLQHDGCAVIGDMGCARAFNEKEETKVDIGTYRWMPPEAIGNEGGIIVATPEMDVYSFGILLWELVTCKVPYTDYSPVQAAVSVVMKGLRPPIPRDCFAPLKCLIEKCWAHEPSQRPTSTKILHMLHIISMQKTTHDT